MTASTAEDRLPDWNLDGLYSGPEAPELERDLQTAGVESRLFAESYKDRLSLLSGAELAEAIAAFEAILDRVHRVMGYGQLLHAVHTADAEVARFYQTLQERVTEITTETLFFTLELNHIDDAVLESQLTDPAAARYAPWVRDTRMYRPHQLSDDMERLLHEKSVAGRNAWMRLFDETMAHLRCHIDGQELTLSDTMNRLSDTDGAVRKSAAEALSVALTDNLRVLAMVTNVLAKDKEIEDRWRAYDDPMGSRNLANQVEPEVVEALVSAVRDNYGDLSHRYYRLKARWMGVEKLNTWDRNAPLPEDSDRRFSWDEARRAVLGAYGEFSPEMAKTAGRFFDDRWIDAAPKPGKSSGAFSHPLTPSAHPYVLLNYHGKARDVMTLAHELGHGVHQVLAADQGLLLADTPLTLAETASVFGEMLTFRAMLDAETDPLRRRVLLAGKVEDMLNTVVRQIAFHTFESRVHAERRDGELSVERLAEIWIEVQRESLGPVFEFDDAYRVFWAYIPHFIHAPFYVYAYAFGDCLVNSLYDVFQGGHENFQAKYLDMLRAGGTLRHKELLAPFGLDASDPDFWKRGLGVISGFIDELEASF